jgi:hypothetical protein
MSQPHGAGCKFQLPITMPPIGSATNAETSCSPCAEQPVDCTKAVSELNAKVCALTGQYTEMLRKYGKLQGKLVTQAQYIKQFLDEQARLRRLISQTEDATGCSSNDAESFDSILGCDGGTPKGMSPGANCAGLVGVGGKWKVVPHGLSFRPLTTPQSLGAPSGVFTDLTDYDEVVKVGCKVWGVCSFSNFVAGTSSIAAGTMLLTLNGIAAGALYISGGGTAAMGGIAIFPMTEKKITASLNASFTGSVTQSTQSLTLLGYLV